MIPGMPSPQGYQLSKGTYEFFMNPLCQFDTDALPMSFGEEGK